MPIREYECRECRLKFEIIELAGDTGTVECPRCNSKDVEKKFSMFSSSPHDGTSCHSNRGFSRGFG